MSEVELCNSIKRSNLFPNFKLHEEVGISGTSCDMIYEDGTDVYTIEAKTEFNFKVLQQALRWQRVATVSFIAIPAHKYSHQEKIAVLEALGLGAILVDNSGAAWFPYNYDPFENPMWAQQKFYKMPADLEYWKQCFERLPENSTPAGSRSGERSTTFSRTIAALKLEAQKHPEYNLGQLLANVPTHYHSVASASSALKRYAKYNVIEKFWKD